MKMWLLPIILLLSSSAFGAHYVDKNEMKLVKAIHVSINDDVKDGCLPNPNELKLEAEEILKNAGITIPEEEWYSNGSYLLYINPVGFELVSEWVTTGQCAVVWSIDLIRFAVSPEGHIALIDAFFTNNSLMIGLSKKETQAELLENVTKVVSELAGEISKAKAK